MRNLKKAYFVKIENDLTRIIIIRRKPKKQSPIRKRMWWAWNNKWDNRMFHILNVS